MNSLAMLGPIIFAAGFAACLVMVEITDRIAARKIWRREGD